jgi:hypothetical protein
MTFTRLCFGVSAVLVGLSARTADRHVYLNTSGAGSQLNDCPNPTHAADGTANAAKLEYCPTTTPRKLICDPGGAKACKSWTVTSASCPGKLPVTSSSPIATIAVDVDGDGVVAEPLYGSPQACVWNMDPSDACDVHAGTYKRGGTIADWNVAGSPGVVDRSDCWIATVGALGHGRNSAIGTDGQGYGTSASPAYLRGAQLDANRDGDVLDAHEVDTWDENGNKVPDRDEGLTSYPAVFSGDADLDGTPKEPSVCSTSGAVGGDAFYPLMWGCGGSGATSEVCKVNIGGGSTRPQVDTDANGSFDTMLPGGPRDVSNFVIKNIEGTGYGGGPVTCTGSGIREKLGHFSIGGDGSSGGFVADRIYFHDNDYSNLCANEHYVAVFGDDENHGCAKDHEIRNSNIVQDNRFTINDDSDSWGGGDTESGCGWYVHDNRVDIVSNPGCSGQGCRKGFIRFKSVDSLQGGARKKQFRVVNNDFTWETSTTDQNFPWFIHTECIGECGPYNPGLGEFWFYGNIFHYRAGAAGATVFGGYSCTSDGSPDTHTFRYYSFNNTWDGARTGAESAQSLGAFCNSTGEIIVSRNNAFYRSTSVNTTNGDTKRFANDRCTESAQTGCTQSNTNGSGGTPRSNWWTAGTWGVGANASLANYIPRTGGPLDNTGSCDPDGDGVQGVDYDNNPATGVNGQETTWKDIAGNMVDCSTSGNPAQTIDIGAIQNSTSGGGNPPPNVVTGVQRNDDH